MPTLIPSKLRTDDVPAGERRLHAAFSKLSDDRWVILHSVAWQGFRGGHPADGEADFVLLHPDKGVLVVEVKGGAVSVDQGAWHSRDAAGALHRVKDPFDQAVDSKHNLVRHLRDRLPDLPHLPAGHAVAFPDLPTLFGLGPTAAPEFTITKAGMATIDDTVAVATAHWEMHSAGLATHMDAIVAALAPSTQVRVLLRDIVAEANARLIALTDEQMRTLDSLQRNRRAVVYGPAGSGKTVLAVEKARRLAADGHRVLLVCFNKPLGEHLRMELIGVTDVAVHTFHGLCEWQARTAKLAMPDERSQDWWDEAARDLLVEAAAETGFAVDAVVVDEGQDFLPSWFEALEMLTGDPATATLYVFADPEQAIYRADWTPPFSEPAFDLTLNCRNTGPIAERVAAVFGHRVAPLTAHGPVATVVVVENADGAIAALPNILHRLVNEGKLAHHQMMVLTERSDMRSRLQGQTIAGVPLTDTKGDGVRVETVHRFKGLEADAVVLLLDDTSDHTPALAYIGMSRARSHLTVVADRATLDTIRWE